MKKSILITSIIFWALIMVIGFIWTLNVIDGYKYVIEDYGNTNLSFGDYLKNGLSLTFFAGLLTFFVGIFRLFFTIFSIDFGASKDKAIVSITRYKELLDTGAITQEEFDAKKREILKL